jgi:hypothetical protein
MYVAVVALHARWHEITVLVARSMTRKIAKTIESRIGQGTF